jgi:hypothetical protein
MNDLNFVKGKWLITKNIDVFVISCWFECWVPLFEELLKCIDKSMKLSIDFWWTIVELDCNISKDTSNYLSFQWDHWLVKLDVILPDKLLLGYIVIWKINLIFNK